MLIMSYQFKGLLEYFLLTSGITSLTNLNKFLHDVYSKIAHFVCFY